MNFIQERRKILQVKKLLFYEISPAYLEISNCEIEELHLCEGLQSIWCEGNNLKYLELPDSVSYIYCDKGVELSRTDLEIVMC